MILDFSDIYQNMVYSCKYQDFVGILLDSVIL
jgi:hypothetical protein